MSEDNMYGLPRWVLAVGPVVILGFVFGLLYLTSPFGNIEDMADAGTGDILLMLSLIGLIAGIVPVAIGMLWFPFIQSLQLRYLHGFIALAGGVLAFIALEMTGEILEHGAMVDSTALAATAALVGIGGTFAVMYGASQWRQGKMAEGEKSGLQIAYLVALALGLHSIGEGLGVGVAFVQGDATLVTLLVLAFIMHNVMEGPTVVAAVAKDHSTPPLHHFAAMGVIAGGPVILGGWIGSLANSDLLAVLFYAIAVGAVIQVLLEVADLIRFDSKVFTKLNVSTFIGGFVLMFLLEDVLTELLLEGWLVPV
ncbi:metal cation transporter [Halobacteria archaeon AArc-curdl1]|uniref:Metal cation transporter n=1 Tax=Natronosalvus hydrolyticus TaxID=2979988 RepID=A0AAP2Z8N0_9EURY|nr:metal cation transporter [Halobacteria archaeon AArc-curdl1]